MPRTITTAAELRAIWQEFWVERQHTLVKSSSLIPTHPSAPMFTNSGMIQFVPYFLGEEPVPFSPPRAASIQKCVRAGGKHNDLDAIGRSLRHLSFFEMLGNWSFGDYFKRDAIRWAWEFVVDVLGIDGDRIWVTVHLTDDEAAEIWHHDIGIPPERIQRLDKDNFWEMGETGPCGPSSELFYDFGPEHGPDGGPANPEAESRFIEFWNLVFMQYFRNESGLLLPLPNKNVDTGAGLERIVGLLRGGPSLFTCDTLSTLVTKVETLTGRKLGTNEADDIAMRLIADHARSMTFLIADGVVPSNEERGYVLRRIIRRAIRFAYLLGVKSHITPALAGDVIDLLGNVYPEIVAGRELILRTLEREESQFRRTLQTGLAILEDELGTIPDGGSLPGSVAFTLHDTYGFPIEVTEEIVADRGISVDIESFQANMTAQRARGRAARKRTGVGDRQAAYQQLLHEFGPTDFTGRREYSSEATVVGVLPGDEFDEIFLDRTPFYAEQGGQVGDTGVLVRQADGTRFAVTDTIHAVPGLHLHKVTRQADRLSVGDSVTASIDAARREAIRRNHTGTHLLHWALRKVLGDHVKQQGSLVAPDRLRFDFSHFEPVTQEQKYLVEDLVNEEILGNATVRQYETTQDDALAKGAIAFFGEKYGDRVRVIEAGDHSLELCGGTHVPALGAIGMLKIVSESSVGANLRRIEAVTGMGTVDVLRRSEQAVADIAAAAGVPQAQAQAGVRKRLAELKSAQAENKRLLDRLDAAAARDLIAGSDGSVLVALLDRTEPDALRRIALQARAQGNLEVVILGSVTSAGRPSVAVAVAPDAGTEADQILEPIAKAIGGGGRSKQRDVAVTGGRDASQLPRALDEARKTLNDRAGSLGRA
jgi:alanyl-tRNA synthetase